MIDTKEWSLSEFTPLSSQTKLSFQKSFVPRKTVTYNSQNVKYEAEFLWEGAASTRKKKKSLIIEKASGMRQEIVREGCPH